MNYWYVARAHELMLDVDAPTRDIASDERRRAYLGPTRVRLEAAIRSGVLRVQPQLYIYPSRTANHFHVIIPLVEPMDDIPRFIWEMQLRSDLYRGRCNIMRALNRTPAPGLLIAPERWTGFPRIPDAICGCVEQHNLDVFAKCPAARMLRGDEASREGYFGALRRNRVVPPLLWKKGGNDTAIFAHTHEPIDDPEGELVSSDPRGD